VIPILYHVNELVSGPTVLGKYAYITRLRRFLADTAGEPNVAYVFPIKSSMIWIWICT